MLTRTCLSTTLSKGCHLFKQTRQGGVQASAAGAGERGGGGAQLTAQESPSLPVLPPLALLPITLSLGTRLTKKPQARAATAAASRRGSSS